MNSRQLTLNDMLPIITQTLDSGGEFTMIPSGQSMLPTICGGSDTVALVAAKGPLRRYDLPLYRREDGSFVLHRMIGLRTDGYVMCGDAQLCPEHGIKQAQIIGIVNWYTHDGRKIRCKGLFFRLGGMRISIIRTFRRIKNKTAR